MFLYYISSPVFEYKLDNNRIVSYVKRFPVYKIKFKENNGGNRNWRSKYVNINIPQLSQLLAMYFLNAETALNLGIFVFSSSKNNIGSFVPSNVPNISLSAKCEFGG